MGGRRAYEKHYQSITKHYHEWNKKAVLVRPPNLFRPKDTLETLISRYTFLEFKKIDCSLLRA
jgi:hypothetical protein